MEIMNKFYRETAPISQVDSFLVFEREKEFFDFPIHYHPEYELNFILNAPGAMRVVGDHVSEISDIELVFVGPNLYHGWETNNCTTKKIHEVTIQFHNNLFDESLLSRRIMMPIKELFYRSKHGILFSKEKALELKPRLLKVSKLDGIDYFLEIISILYDLSISRNQILLSTFTVDSNVFIENDTMRTVHKYIQEHFASKLSLSEVANIANMSVVSFNRFIKKKTNKTFVNYVNEIRIGYASRWLIEKDMSISEIAFNSGFNNIANFNRIFKSIKNSTPSQYREDFIGLKKIL